MKSPARTVCDSRVQCAVTLALPVLQGEMFAQTLFAGLIGRATPVGPQPRSVLVDHTHNYRQTVESLQAFLLLTGASINAGTPARPRLCLLDVAPVHVSFAFLKAMRA